MLKAIALVMKKSGLSDAQFYQHWREVHAPLVKHIKDARRYVQRVLSNYVVDRARLGAGSITMAQALRRIPG